MTTMMKPSHFSTPRSLNECQFTPGYTTQPVFNARAEAIGGVVLAVLIGVGLAAALVAWWSS